MGRDARNEEFAVKWRIVDNSAERSNILTSNSTVDDKELCSDGGCAGMVRGEKLELLCQQLDQKATATR